MTTEEDLIPKNQNDIEKNIATYIEDLYKRTNEKINDPTTPIPEKQHMVPNLILRRIGASDFTKPKKKEKLREHKIEFDPKTKDITFSLGGEISSGTYSVQANRYNSNSFGDEYFLEHLFSIIETDAARLIDARIAETYGGDFNPFSFNIPYNLPEDELAPTDIEGRIRFSAFLAIQLLRYEPSKGPLSALVSKMGQNSIDYANDVLSLISSAIKEVYCRQWFWIRTPQHEMIITKTGTTTISTCVGHAGVVMPFSRRNYIYLSEIPGSHFLFNDKIIQSNSSVFYRWYCSAVSEKMIKLEAISLPNGNEEMRFMANKEAHFDKQMFTRPDGCCFSCVINSVRYKSSTKLYLFNDVEKDI